MKPGPATSTLVDQRRRQADAATSCSAELAGRDLRRLAIASGRLLENSPCSGRAGRWSSMAGSASAGTMPSARSLSTPAVEQAVQVIGDHQ